MKVADLKGKRIGVAVSGGLDSCTITRWLADNGAEVICLIGDLGQPDEPDLELVRQRMLACGATDALIVYAQDGIAHAGLQVIQAMARYEGGYWNTTGIARHITVLALIMTMSKLNLNILVHGATGRGNDQVRFQLATNMIEPGFEVYAPWRDPAFLKAFGGRKEMIEFCEARGLPIKVTLDKPYSTDANLLGLTHEAGKLEFLTTPANFVKAEMGNWPADAPDNPAVFSVSFVKGMPISVNGEQLDLKSIFKRANEIGGTHGIGIGLHTVENRFVGIKSRGVYEAPGMELLAKCYEFLLQLIMDRRAREFYDYISLQLGKQIYQGYWFDPASQMMRAALAPITALATGVITVSLYKGNVIFNSAEGADFSLYSDSRSSMEKVGEFDHQDSEGFLRVLGVSARALASVGQILVD